MPWPAGRSATRTGRACSDRTGRSRPAARAESAGRARARPGRGRRWPGRAGPRRRRRRRRSAAPRWRRRGAAAGRSRPRRASATAASKPAICDAVMAASSTAWKCVQRPARTTPGRVLRPAARPRRGPPPPARRGRARCRPRGGWPAAGPDPRRAAARTVSARAGPSPPVTAMPEAGRLADPGRRDRVQDEDRPAHAAGAQLERLVDGGDAEAVGTGRPRAPGRPGRRRGRRRRP